MTSERHTDIVPISSGGFDLDLVDETAPEVEHPARKLKRLLRHRYRWLAILMLAGIVAGGALGYKTGKQTYRSEAIISVKPVMPKILFNTEQQSIVPMFDGFVERLVAMIQSPRVIDLAMNRDEWKRFGFGTDPVAREEFVEALKVSTAGRNQLIYIHFEDESPTVAQAAVQSVVATFQDVYKERDIYSVDNKLQVLEKRRVDLTNELRSIRARILEIANEFGSDVLVDRYRYQVQELQKLNSMRESINLELVSLEATVAKDPEAADDVTTDYSDTELLLGDPLGRDYVAQHRRAVLNVESLQHTYGPNHTRVQNAQQDVEHIEQLMASRAAELREKIASGVDMTRPDMQGLTAAQRVDALKQQLAQIDQLYQQRYQETLALGRKNLQIDALKAEQETVEQRLAQTDARIEELKVESSGVGGRLETLSEGDRPTLPYKDTRIKYAAVFGFGGGALGFGIILLIALIDSRLRSVDDAATTMPNVNMLGILPELPRDINDPDAALIASRAVHQIRTLLQLTSPSDGGGSAATITSPVPNSGKTSLAHALGISFALAGTRTLLIDMDLAGGGLTRRTGAAVRRRLGDILRRSGRLTEAQINEAVNQAQSNEKIGRTLVRLNHITEDELQFALHAQTTSILGTVDALHGEPLAHCVAQTPVPGLDILPLGNAGAHDISRIAPKYVGALVAEAKKRYDAVLIDTGPMPGCLEASVAASRTDTTVLIVPKNANRSLTQQALNQLGTVGAKVAGVVFNRASEADFRASGASTLQLSTRDPEDVRVEPITRDVPENYDPLARAVYSYAPPSQDNGASNGSANGKGHPQGAGEGDVVEETKS